MSKQGSSFKDALQSIFATGAIVIALLVSLYLYFYIMGDGANFEGGNPKGAPLPGNYLATIYKGGFIVPILMTCVLTIFIFTFERAISLGRAKGKGSLNTFVRNLQNLLANDKIEEALAACDAQRCSLANVMKAGLTRYRDLQKDQDLEKDQKILSIQKSLEEATALELPMLSRNLVMFSTLASISVLIGLIGTVLGMIRAFAALAQAGAPDALALATGISEALINTALGIIASVVGIIMYNFFSNKIDALTYSMDEASFSIINTVSAQK